MAEEVKWSRWEIREMERRLDAMRKEMVSLREDVDQRFSRVDHRFWNVYGEMNTQWRWIGTIVMVIVAVLIVAVVKLLP